MQYDFAYKGLSPILLLENENEVIININFDLEIDDAVEYTTEYLYDTGKVPDHLLDDSNFKESISNIIEESYSSNSSLEWNDEESQINYDNDISDTIYRWFILTWEE